LTILPNKTNSKLGRPGRKKAQAANDSISRSFTAPSVKEHDVHMLWELLDGLHVGVANVLPSGKVLYANTRFLESLGIPQHHDPSGVQLNDYVAPSCWDAMYEALGRAIQVPVDGEFQVAAVGENPRTIRLSLGPVCTEQGPTVRIVATEVTELVETNRALRETEASLRSLSARILQLQDQERRRIARDLHDTTGQELAVIVMSLKHLSNSLDQPGFDARKAIAEVSELARQVNDEIRTLSYLLHPPLLDEFGLGSALKWYVEGFNKRSGIDVALEVSEKLPRFASDKEMALFRVVQESLTNVMRHSGSRKAWIRVTQNRGVVQVGVEDEGSGIDAAILGRLACGPKALGVGIPGLRERLRQLGGRLEISSSSGGTRLVAVLPAESASVPDDVSRSAEAPAAESLRDSSPPRRPAGLRNVR
jgi:signal transduction histidine kinase